MPQDLSIEKYVAPEARHKLMGQTPYAIWLTGLSGAGKSTLACKLDQHLHACGYNTVVLDGDNLRHGLNSDLRFSDADRAENIRRIAEVAKLMVDAGLIALIPVIAPFRASRRMARSLFPEGRFLEVFVDTPLDVCMARDGKGLYKKAKAGQIKDMTGLASPYERPEHADLILQGELDPDVLLKQIIQLITERKLYQENDIEISKKKI